MQCRNCRFQNMPGSDVCGRCGTSLGLATAVMDVHPPRAGRLAKRFRRVLPRGRAYYEARHALIQTRNGAAAAARRVAPDVPRLPPAPVCLRLVIPGWSHFYLGQRWRGRFALWGWLIFLVPGLFWFGTTAGSILLGLAFSVHSSAALDIVSRTLPADVGLRQRMAHSIAVSLVIGVALYWPAGWLITRVADPRSLTESVGPLESGDVMLVNHWRAPAAGRVVLYELPNVQQAMTRLHGETYYRFSGERIDRILAGPGDKVRWKDGRLTVNGTPSPLLPLDNRPLPAALAFMVPADHFLILPSTTPQVRTVRDDATWHALSVVPAGDIRGQVYLRSHPLRRLMVIR
jgi:type IV secretory pathway protease TraF